MTDHFDAELRRSFQEYGEKSLKGFEFTPAMQQRVLQQIRAEESGAVSSTTRPARHLPGFKQMVWVVAAAAAFVIAIRIGSFGVMGSHGPGAASKASPMAAPAAPAPAPGAAKQSDQTAAGAAAAPATASAPAPAPVAPPAGPESGAAAAAGTAPAQPSAPTYSAAMGTRAYGVFQLTLPDSGAADGSTRNSPAAAPRTPSLMAPAQPLGLAAAPGGGEVRELSQVGVLALDSQGSQVWMQPIAGINDLSRLAVAPDGRVAVSTGAHVSVLGPTGNLLRSMSLAGTPAALVWSGDGRLAVALPSGVYVYGQESLQFSVTGLANPGIAFGADGALAVLADQGGSRKLMLYGPDGNRIMTATPAGTARALAFSPDGSMILAGGRAFDRSGAERWQAPFDPDGALALPDATGLLLWNSQTALAVDAASGAGRWRDEWSGSPGITGAAVSANGAYVGLVASTQSGGALWILQNTGLPALSEALPAAPGQLAFAGDRLLFVLNGAVQGRSIQP